MQPIFAKGNFTPTGNQNVRFLPPDNQPQSARYHTRRLTMTAVTDARMTDDVCMATTDRSFDRSMIPPKPKYPLFKN